MNPKSTIFKNLYKHYRLVRMFPSPRHIAVLEFFLKNPDKELSFREILRSMKLGVNSSSDYVRYYIKRKILIPSSLKSGKTQRIILYSLNKNAPDCKLLIEIYNEFKNTVFGTG